MSIFKLEDHIDEIDTDEFSQFYDILNSICGKDEETSRSKVAIVFYLSRINAKTGDVINSESFSIYDPYLEINTSNDYYGVNLVFNDKDSENLQRVCKYAAKYLTMKNIMKEDEEIIQSTLTFSPINNIEGMIIVMNNPKCINRNALRPFRKENAVKFLFNIEDIDIYPLVDEAE